MRRVTAATPLHFAAAVTLAPQLIDQAHLITAAIGPERQKRTKGKKSSTMPITALKYLI
jgi:hypothetical protein